MQKTNSNQSYQQPQLVIAAMGSDGKIDTSSYQSLNEWNNGTSRNTELCSRVYGRELVDILTNELGLIDVDEEGLLRHKIVITPDPHVSAMRLLGKIAEAVIVKKCNDDIFSNRCWGMYARKGMRPHKSLDSFKAVGTGLNSAYLWYPTKYNPTNTQRDIVWINKENPVEELKQISRFNNSAVSAGIQLKVSMDGFKYIYRNDIARGKYEVPLVYFDLRDDYYRLTNAIYAEDRSVIIGTDIIRGRDVDRECHDILLSYYSLVYELISGRLNINDLIRNELLFDSFTKEIQEQQDKKIIVV
ncbi:MAG: hypothetical protein PHQ03_05805 [Methylococcales bacterium]|nr:hypothetical protein [Methylococcales bacterium]